MLDEHRMRVFEKRFLRKISGSRREEFTGGWKTCTVVNDVICNRIKGYYRCVGRVARIVKTIKAYAILVAKCKVKGQFRRAWVQRMLILKWILKNRMVGYGLD
jgi:hypothetical protein